MAEKKAKPSKPLKTADPIPKTSHSEFMEAQHSNNSVAHLWVKANDKTESGNGNYKYTVNNGLLYMTQNVGNSVKGEPQLVVSNEMRKRVTGLFEDVHHYCCSCDVCQRNILKGKGRQSSYSNNVYNRYTISESCIDIVGPITPARDRGNR